MTLAEDKKRKLLEQQNRIRRIQLLIKQAFPDGGDLIEWLKSTTGYDKPFPADTVLHNRAEGQRELVITIMNMVKRSPEEIIKYFMEGNR
jgi:hypothetical protein